MINIIIGVDRVLLEDYLKEIADQELSDPDRDIDYGYGYRDGQIDLARYILKEINHNDNSI